MARYRLKRKLYSTNNKTYRLKRKNYSFGDAVGQVAQSGIDTAKQVTGGAMDVTGKVLQSADNFGTRILGAGAGGVAGALAGAKLGTMLLPGLGTVIGGLAGILPGTILGKTAVKTVGAAGRGLSDAGQNLQV